MRILNIFIICEFIEIQILMDNTGSTYKIFCKLFLFYKLFKNLSKLCGNTRTGSEFHLKYYTIYGHTQKQLYARK
jgi:hypothetical protein